MSPRAQDRTRSGGAPGQIRLGVGGLGVAVMLAAALVHACTAFSPLPWWDMSPLVVSPSMSGMGPAQVLVTNLALLTGAVLVFIGEAQRGAPLHAPAIALAAAGAAGVLLHGWVLATAGLGNQQTGSTWAAAIAGMVAMMHACRDAGVRRLAVAVILGFLALLALKGVQQVLLEHPRTVANFEENREQILAAHGWSPDSPMARGYERRLKQPDPSGWFALSNVFASFMGAGAAALLALLAAGLRRRPRPRVWVLLALSAAGLGAAGALALTYSKGGLGAFALGLATFAAIALFGRRLRGARAHRVAGLAALAAVLLPIFAVVVRGLFGERLAHLDLSLLFRWYYWQGAARIAADHPVTGVGPSGFQEAYLSARPPLSVEEVTSPHGLPFDFIATLGLFGAAWVGLFFLVVWRIGCAAATAPGEPPDAPGPEADRQEMRLAFLIGAVASLIGAWLDTQTVLPHGAAVTVDGALVWLLGLVAWWTVTAAALRVLRESPAAAVWGSAAAALVLAIHAQVEVTPVQGSSAALFFVVLGAAGASPAPPRGPEAARSSDRAGALRSRFRLSGSPRLARSAGFAVAVLTALFALPVAQSAWRARIWQGSLREAAELLAPIPDIRTRLSLPEEEPDAARHRAEALADLSRLAGRPVEAPEPWLTMLQVQRSEPAAEALLEAAAVYPENWRVRRAAAWLLMENAAVLRPVDPGASGRLIGEAKGVLRGSWDEPGQAATGELRAYGTLLENAAVIEGSSAPLREAAGVLEQVAERDPYDLQLAVSLARHYRTLGDDERAAHWAERALEVEAFKRLDRDVHGLSEAERQELRGLLP